MRMEVSGEKPIGIELSWHVLIAKKMIVLGISLFYGEIVYYVLTTFIQPDQQQHKTSCPFRYLLTDVSLFGWNIPDATEFFTALIPCLCRQFVNGVHLFDLVCLSVMCLFELYNYTLITI